MDKNVEKFKKAEDLKAYVSGGLPKIKDYIKNGLSGVMGIGGAGIITLGTKTTALGVITGSPGNCIVGASIITLGAALFHASSTITKKANEERIFKLKTEYSRNR